MEPALITAGAALAGGLMSQAAAKKEAERQRKFQAEQAGFSNQIDAIKTGTQGDEAAFARLMDAYKSALT